MSLTSTTTTCLRSISRTDSDSSSSSTEIALRQFYNLEFKLRLSRVQTQTLESNFELRLKKSFITSVVPEVSETRDKIKFCVKLGYKPTEM